MEDFEDPSLATHARKALKNDWVKPTKRVFNNAKVSDHHAIIPTGASPARLDEFERKIYDMVARRTIAVFYPAAQFEVTTRITRVEGEPFKTDGKISVDPGWLAVYGREAGGEGEEALATVSADESAKVLGVEVRQNETKPTARFTEATLLSAMEGAGKLVEDEELREAMSEKGLGTPATRSSVIEGLIYEKYILRAGRDLQPTAKAFSLMALLRGLSIPELISPELTGDWEVKLKQMERGRLRREEFMKEIAAMTREIVRKAKEHEHDTIPGDFGELKVPCPKCGGVIKETYKNFQCSNEKCDFALWKIAAGRQFEAHEIEQLITQRTVGPLQGFRSKKGRPFAAIIKLTDELKPEFDFGQEEKNAAGEVAEVDFTGQEPLGKCPKCGARVFESGMSYICEKATGATKTCEFHSGKIILQQAVERAQMTK